MVQSAGFLYGDSTPSPLKSDFIALLRDTFDFAVEVLRADARMATAVRAVGQLAEETEREIALADELATDVARALEGPALRAPGSLAGRCAMRIQESARDCVRLESDAARAAVAAERDRLGQTAAAEHAVCTKAFETLVVGHTPPDALCLTLVKLVKGDGGSRYEALQQCQTPYGLEWTTELEIPPGHALARVMRVDRLAERLEVDAPEEGGWLHKEVRNRPQRLDRLYLTAMSVHPSETTVCLRASDDGSGAGFDLALRSDPAQVDLVRIVEAGGGAEAPFRVTGEDAVKLHALREGLAALASELGDRKKSLRQASLDGVPVQKLDSPRLLVDKLVASMAPTVHEIAKRSLTPGELVVKRLVGDSRREEVFVSKRELEQKIEALPPELRAAFDPLELWSPAPLPKVMVSAGKGSRSSAPPPPKAVSGAPIQVISSPPPAPIVEWPRVDGVDQLLDASDPVPAGSRPPRP